MKVSLWSVYGSFLPERHRFPTSCPWVLAVSVESEAYGFDVKRK
jgi:hypothetical protein